MRCRPLLLLLLLTTLLPHQGWAQTIPGATVAGYVYDAVTDAALPGANVFLAGTMFGAATNDNGFFEIRGVPLGSHELVVSYLGYTTGSQRLRLTTLETQEVLFRLDPLVLQEDGIQVTAISDREWRKQFATFRKFFLGISRYADKCTILNPEVLDFNETQGRFVATAREPLLIDNKALGYRLRFVLDDFELEEDKQYIKYGGRVSFSELVPGSDRERRRWEKRREEAYNGSLRHFLSALVQDRLWDEGFLLLSEEAMRSNVYSGVPGSRPSARVSGVKPIEVLSQGELPFERKLSFVGYLKVIYFDELPSGQFLKLRRYSGRQLPSSEDEQVSYIALNQPNVVITTDGHLQDGFGLTKFGYWYFERVADLLPREYIPQGQPAIPVPDAIPNVNLANEVREGVEQVEAGRYESAVASLAPVVAEAPGFATARHGTAAYWLGRAYAALDRSEAAHQAWRDGLLGLAERDTFSVRLGDTFIQSVFATQDQEAYAVASLAYLELLEQHGLVASDADRAIIRRHIVQALPTLTPEETERVVDGDHGPLYQGLELFPGAGSYLALVWRGQDPLPASALNERVAEHLARVQYAEANFAFDGSPERYDARGRAYVRFGPPFAKTSIIVDISHATQGLRSNGYAMPGTLIPPMNEFWTYRHIDDLIYFIFYLDGGRFREGGPEDLIPSDLMDAHKRSGIGHTNSRTTSNPTGDRTPVNQVLAEALFEVWKGIYTQLATYHPAFDRQREELEMQEADIQATKFGDSRTISASALSFVSGTETQFKALTRQSIRQREEEAPPSHSRVASAIEDLPVPFRYARFLEEDGTTRTELYWTHVPGTLAMTRRQRRTHLRENEEPPDDYLVEMTVNLYSGDYRRQVPSSVQYMADDLEAHVPAPVQQVELLGSTEPYNLGLQWDQFVAEAYGEEVNKRAYLRTGTAQATDLTPLSADPAVLEMSDLKPVVTGPAGRPIVRIDDASPDTPVAYPFDELYVDLTFGLVFEVYHLSYNANDQVAYTIEYEVVRDAGQRNEKRTAARTPYTGTSTTSREYIGIDLSPFAGGGPLAITIRVTDDVTGRTVERSIDFTLKN